MNTIKQTLDKLEFISLLSPMTRIFLLLFGLIPLIAPYALLIKPAWNGRISIVMLFFMAISVGAISVSIFFIAGALLGRSQHFQFDASNRVIRYRFKTTINPFREECYDFSEIEAFEIKVNEWDSYSNTYDISMKIREKREMKFGDFTSKQDAEHYLAKIKTKLFI